MPSRQPPVPTKLKDRASALIRKKLLNGELPAGSRLSEELLAKEAGISRTPIREAMMELKAAGVVDQLPRFGWFIRTPSREELIELYEIRELLECHAVGKAAVSATPEQISLIDSLVDQLHQLICQLHKSPTRGSAADCARMTSLDLAFHEQILKASGNAWVAKLSAQCRLIGRLYIAKSQQAPTQDAGEVSPSEQASALAEFTRAMYRTLRQHSQIARAIRCRRAEQARDLMALHIRAGLAKALKYADESQARSALAGGLAAAYAEGNSLQ